MHEIPPDRPSFKTWQVPSVPFSCHLDRLPTAISQLPTPFHELPPPPSRLLVTASFGRILPTSLLEKFAPGRRLNVHPSLLPIYRGPAPIQHALLDGQKETGVCVIEMTELKKGIDSGDIWGRTELVSSIPCAVQNVRAETKRPCSADTGRCRLPCATRYPCGSGWKATRQRSARYD